MAVSSGLHSALNRALGAGAAKELLELLGGIEGGTILLDNGTSYLEIDTPDIGLSCGTADNQGLFAYAGEIYLYGNGGSSIGMYTNFSGTGGTTLICQDGTAGAAPAVHLKQDDVSEEFIRFTGTAADDVITNSLVAAADVTTFTPAGYVKVNVQDVGNQITDGAYFVQIGTIEV